MQKAGYQVIYLEPAVDDLSSLPKSVYTQIVKAVQDRLTEDPFGLGKPLRYALRGQRRLRVGDYRVIYRIEGKTVLIEAIGNRKDIYG